MRFYTLLAAIFWMAAQSNFLLAAEEPNISLVERFQSQEAPKITVQSIYNFERELSVRVRKDPRFIPSDVLIRTVSDYKMTDANGIEITSGFDIDTEHDLVVAFSGGTAEIIKSMQTGQGLQVISSFRNAGGQFVSPLPDRIALYNTSGDRLCHTYEDVQSVDPEIAITILLDRSGSMAQEIGLVKSAAHQFLTNLPSSAQCAVASFNTGWHYGHEGFLSCNTGNFGFESITATGGTDIYAPLKSTYQRYSEPELSSYQKAVIIVTDGYTLEDEERKAELMALRGDVLTLVYFVGGNKRDELEGITDHFIAEGGDISRSITQYFHTLSAAYNSQKVLTVQSCEASAP
ncbi:MAG: hypothetical protein NPIRA05_09660 [Nitrospirales bacterium]|nr:MAG: hypothetical protein NPIRA05_09660 [Nitrospirales bacterium]